MYCAFESIDLDKSIREILGALAHVADTLVVSFELDGDRN
jgi:hypothetical protein